MGIKEEVLERIKKIEESIVEAEKGIVLLKALGQPTATQERQLKESKETLARLRSALETI